MKKEKTREFPSELSFIKDIIQHESRLENDFEVSDLRYQLKIFEVLTAYFTIICNYRFIFFKAVISSIFYHEINTSSNIQNKQLKENIVFALLIINSIINSFFSI